MKLAMKSLAAVTLCVLAGSAAAQKDPDQGMDQPKKTDDSAMKAEPQAPQGGEVMAEKLSATATVDKIDKKDREVTLSDAQGGKFKVTVPDEVKNFDNIKKGDKVTLDYYSSVALSLEKSDAKMSAGAEQMAAKSPGELPGGMVAQKIDETVKVEKVDKAKNNVTVKLPDGERDTIHVTDSDLQADLGKIKKGDKIHATYTQGVAVTIAKADKTKPKAKNKG